LNEKSQIKELKTIKRKAVHRLVDEITDDENSKNN
jgi:hypothetical protein